MKYQFTPTGVVLRSEDGDATKDKHIPAPPDGEPGNGDWQRYLEFVEAGGKTAKAAS